jgi:glycosyltransferase involved in cell wall biosynthesis
MNIVFFSNPDFFGSQKRPAFSSMPRYTQMLAEGMVSRGHSVSIWAPGSTFFKLPVKGVLKKWMGYFDQYVVFPGDVRKRLKESPEGTLFVFTDQAQGPWVPLVRDRRHVMHCHDFLAQWSALGLIAENKTGWTGRSYQRFIRKGFRYCRNFISGSQKTNDDLKRLTNIRNSSLNVVYNGLDDLYRPMNVAKARTVLGNKIGLELRDGYLLHVGGNQWYKNRLGVLEIYDIWRRQYGKILPLIMIGAEPSTEMQLMVAGSPWKNDIHFISGLADVYVRYAYSGASVFLFPSLAEGFGWPIAEAMGCGCPVITTDSAPMTEVAGGAALLLEKRTAENASRWAVNGATLVESIVAFSHEERSVFVERSLNTAKRFDIHAALDEIESIYKNIAEKV